MGLKHSIPHDLGQDLARKVTRHALETYRRNFAEYSPEGEWVDENHARVRFKAAGQTLEGRVEVQADRIDLELDVPFFLRPFRGAAIKVIEDEIRSWINRARRGELDDEA